MKFAFTIWGLVVLVIFTSCDGFFEREVEMPMEDYVPVLSINCELSDRDRDLQVYLTHTQGIFDESPPEVLDEATVELYRNDMLLGQFAFQADEFPYNGIYQLQRDQPLGSDNDLYELRVDAPGYDPVFATQFMPEAVPLLEAKYLLDSSFDEFGEQVSEITFTFQDPPGENFYAFEVSVLVYTIIGQDTLLGTDRVPLSSLDPLVEQGNEELIAGDQQFDGEETTLTFITDGRYTSGGDAEVKMMFNLISITEDRYRYSRAIQAAFNNQDNPFSEPSEIPSNVIGGEGLFSVEATSSLIIDL